MTDTCKECSRELHAEENLIDGNCTECDQDIFERKGSFFDLDAPDCDY